MINIPKFKDLTGLKFGHLYVNFRAQDQISKSGKKRIMWNCTCDCGNEVIVNGDNLKSGKSTSCGCFRRLNSSNIHSTHKQSNTALYGIWSSMKSRCYNPNSNAYKDYGARGISVCPEWKSSFESFALWANNNGYSKSLTLDRTDNDKGYNPDNCRWVTRVAQANNRRSNRLLTYNGETHNIATWAKIVGKSPKTLYTRLYSGWTDEQIVNT